MDAIAHIVYHHGYLSKTPFENIFNIGVMFNEASSIKVINYDPLISSKPFSLRSFLISSYILISKEKKYEHIFPINPSLFYY